MLTRAVVAGLPVGVRAGLCGDIPADATSYLLEYAARSLVSDDLEVAAALFARPDLVNLHGAVLSNGPSQEWMDRALLALEHGWRPEQIVAQTTSGGSGWSGAESQHWQRRIEEFRNLRMEEGQPDAAQRARIIEAGISHFADMHAEASRRERRERVFGRD